ncbi:MAG: hypothetical protein WD739_01435 [Actinomycetota bacterium]
MINRRETRRLAWTEVDGFEVGASWDPAQGGSPALVRLRTGSSVQLQAAGSRSDAAAFIAPLRAEFETALRRTAPPAPPTSSGSEGEGGPRPRK